jgi:hypothetical protein
VLPRLRASGHDKVTVKTSLVEEVSRELAAEDQEHLLVMSGLHALTPIWAAAGLRLQTGGTSANFDAIHVGVFTIYQQLCLEYKKQRLGQSYFSSRTEACHYLAELIASWNDTPQTLLPCLGRSPAEALAHMVQDQRTTLI